MNLVPVFSSGIALRGSISIFWYNCLHIFLVLFSVKVVISVSCMDELKLIMYLFMFSCITTNQNTNTVFNGP